MSQEQWAAVDHYLTSTLSLSDATLEKALQASSQAGLPSINVSAAQGKLLYLMARAQRARKVLEIGTLGGYSTIWLGRALRDLGEPARLVTLEVEEKHARVAKENIAMAGLANLVELRLGKAIDTLPKLATENIAPFDLTFIDADKPSTPDYFRWALKLSHPGSVIIVDNVIRNGAIIDTAKQDAAILGIRRFNDLLASEPRVTATAIQTVGSKGYDGFAMALVVA